MKLSDYTSPPTWPDCVTMVDVYDDLVRCVQDYRRKLLDNLRNRLANPKDFEKVLSVMNRGQRSASGHSMVQAVHDSLRKGALTIAGTYFVETRMSIVAKRNKHIRTCDILTNDSEGMDATIIDYSHRKFHTAIKSAINWGNADQHRALHDHFLRKAESSITKQTELSPRYLLLQDAGPTRPSSEVVRWADRNRGKNRKVEAEIITLTGQACHYFLSGGNPRILMEMDAVIDDIDNTSFKSEEVQILVEGLTRHGGVSGYRPVAEINDTSWLHWSKQPMNLDSAWKKTSSKEVLMSLMEPWWKK